MYIKIISIKYLTDCNCEVAIIAYHCHGSTGFSIKGTEVSCNNLNTASWSFSLDKKKFRPQLIRKLICTVHLAIITDPPLAIVCYSNLTTSTINSCNPLVYAIDTSIIIILFVIIEEF